MFHNCKILSALTQSTPLFPNFDKSIYQFWQIHVSTEIHLSNFKNPKVQKTSKRGHFDTIIAKRTIWHHHNKKDYLIVLPTFLVSICLFLTLGVKLSAVSNCPRCQIVLGVKLSLVSNCPPRLLVVKLSAVSNHRTWVQKKYKFVRFTSFFSHRWQLWSTPNMFFNLFVSW